MNTIEQDLKNMRVAVNKLIEHQTISYDYYERQIAEQARLKQDIRKIQTGCIIICCTVAVLCVTLILSRLGVIS
tara:strand:+ start:1768 stop:1989 length:222 start_codon:yes stop_codon:yes gene_type:complete